MAELTNLESKIGEVLGLAMAAQAATKKVEALLGDEDPTLAKVLRGMHEDAAETEQRCTQVAGIFEGKKTAILDQARETKGEASEMMETYLGGSDVDALDGFEFLTMAEAGEVGHWSIVKKFNERAKIGAVGELAGWALPIQERHFQSALDGSLELAGEEDPNESA
jgi:hypothetical protein